MLGWSYMMGDGCEIPESLSHDYGDTLMAISAMIGDKVIFSVPS